MNITDEKIKHLAHLSRLDFNANEIVEIKKDLHNILALCESLNKIDTDGVEPLIFLTDTKNNTRTDEVEQTITKKEALANAPKKDSDYFRVPKVINEVE